MERLVIEEDKHEGEDNARTIRPSRSPASAPAQLAKPPSSEIEPIFEDYSDLVAEEDEMSLQNKFTDFKVNQLACLF
jgi:hypothetical protein